MQRHEGGYYVRMSVFDRPGTMATIATRMGERQDLARSDHAEAPAPRMHSPNWVVPVVLITHATSGGGHPRGAGVDCQGRGGEEAL